MTPSTAPLATNPLPQAQPAGALAQPAGALAQPAGALAQPSQATVSGRWTHALACLLVSVTAVTLCSGALVTTYDAAMAASDWPSTFGHNLFLYPLGEWFWGPWDLFLEHGHRLLAAIVNLLTLALVAVVWHRESPATIRSLAIAAVVLVVLQDLLGGARVLLDDRTVAKVHACTGPLYFAVAIAIATLTGPRSRLPASLFKVSAAMSWAAASLVVAAYLQLVAGAQLRHLDATVDPAAFGSLVGLHLLGAAAVMALSLFAFGLSWSGAGPAVRRWSLLVLVLVTAQILLGCGAWVVNWGLPSDWLPAALVPTEAIVARSPWGAAVVTSHVVIGMLILGAAVVLAIVSGVLAGDSRHDRQTKRAFA